MQSNRVSPNEKKGSGIGVFISVDGGLQIRIGLSRGMMSLRERSHLFLLKSRVWCGEHGRHNTLC